MALFKICRGNESNLPVAKTDGWAYFCTDTGNFFIDWSDTTGAVNRVQINADSSYSLRYLNGSEYVEVDASVVDAHIKNKSNPHGVTKAQVGLGNVNNTSDANKPVSTAQATAIADAKKAGTDAQDDIDAHAANKSNPHGVTAAQAGADPEGTASSLVGSHNTNTSAHNDIRLLVTDLTNRLNALANSDDTTLDQMAEIVAYIKNNKTLIDGVTTGKVNVTDIVNNLTTNVSNKPLSAAQGVALKAMIDAIDEVTVDSALSTTSTNPVQNKVVKAAIDQLSTNIGKKSDSGHTHDYPVDSVNGKTGAVTLSASDVGARPSNWMPTAADVGARPNTWMPTAADVGAFRNLGVNAMTFHDTTNNWSVIDNGYSYYNDYYLEDQPSQYGLLLHFNHFSEVFQIWRCLNAGPTYWRSGNASGWGSTWNKVYDTANKPTAADVGAVAKSGDTMTGELILPRLNVANSDWAQQIPFWNGSKEVGGIYRQNDNGLFVLYFRHPNAAAQEYYCMPLPNASISENKWYDILTSKNPVTIAQGGTGASDIWNALANLGLPFFRTYYFNNCSTPLLTLQNNYNSIDNVACLIYCVCNGTYYALVGFKVDNYCAFLEIGYGGSTMYKYRNANGTWTMHTYDSI